MRLWRVRAGLGALALGTLLPAQAASAANTATFRDCAFIGGLDPDFVQLSGATVDSQGHLTVPQPQNQVTVKASESSDPGDKFGHVTLSVTVTSPGVPSKVVSGTGTGAVLLSVPLSGAAVGSSYTISPTATFDNGFHHCPSSMTPMNPTANPFVIGVAAGTASVPPAITSLRQTHRVWREPGSPAGKPAAPVGTKFSFKLTEPGAVRFAFLQKRNGRMVRRGRLSFTGHASTNTRSFKGRTSTSRKLKPGRYVAVITTTNAAGQHSPPRSIAFRIVS